MCQISSPSDNLSRRYLLPNFIDFVESLTNRLTKNGSLHTRRRQQEQQGKRRYTLSAQCTSVTHFPPIGDAAYRQIMEEDRAMDIRNTHKKFGKDRACGSGDILADGQTDRQTYRQTYSSQYFATAPTGEIKMLNPNKN